MSQLGGNKFAVMVGVHTVIVTENGVRFGIKAKAANKANRVNIKLNALDTYDVTFGRVTNKKDKTWIV